MIGTMRKIQTMIAAILLASTLNAQNDLGKVADVSPIALTAFLHPDRAESMPAGARESLLNKMTQIATANGLGGEPGQRFILAATVNILDKQVQASAPPMHLVELELTLFIGDGKEGVLFASAAQKIKGLGENETKAYLNALKNVKPKDPEWAELIEQGRSRIIEYYNTKCDLIIQRAMGLSGQEKFEEAMAELMAVPEVCAECHAFAMEAAGSVYRAKADKDCRASMAKAEGALAVGMYREAGEALATGITPAMPCYDEASKLMARIAERGKDDNDGRAWDIEMRKWNDKVDLRKQEIEAWRTVGKAYGEHQRGVDLYNVRGWW